MYKDKPLVSIDIFDTAVFRDVYTPKEVFQVIENKVHNDFSKLRVEAQARAGRINPNFNILDIYNLLPAKFSLKDEIMAEIQGTYANPNILDLYKNNRDRYDFIFISDMYFPSSVLRVLLEHAGYKDPVVFVSCEEGCGKSTGKLFLKVQETLGRKISKHIGDNLRADIEGARKAGIPETEYVGPAVYNKEVVTPPLQNPKLRKFLIDKELSDSPIEEKIGYIFAPLTLAFTQYVLGKATDKQTIFFNSRDSFLMYIIARWILKTEKKIKYCRFSRMSCLFSDIRTEVPLTHQRNRTSFIFLRSRQVQNLNDFLKLLNLPYKSTIESTLKHYGMDLDSSLLLRGDKNQILEKITLCYQNELYEKVKKEKKNFLKYLKKIGIQDNDMLVDIGYKGTIQSIIKRVADINLNGEYIYLCTDLFNDGCQKDSYLPLDSRNLFIGGILEIVFTEPVGSVVSYTDSGQPILHKDLKFRKEISKKLIKGVLKGCKELYKKGIELNLKDCENLLHRYVNNPTLEEATFNNQKLFENGSNEAESAVVFNEALLREGRIRDCYRKSCWKAAFLVLLKNSQEFKHLIGSISK